MPPIRRNSTGTGPRARTSRAVAGRQRVPLGPVSDDPTSESAGSEGVGPGSAPTDASTGAEPTATGARKTGTTTETTTSTGVDLGKASAEGAGSGAASTAGVAASASTAAGPASTSRATTSRAAAKDGSETSAKESERAEESEKARDGGETDDTTEPADPATAARGRRRFTALCAAGLVVGLVAGGVGLYLEKARPGVTYSNEAYLRDDATHEVSTAAATAVQRLVAIDYRRLDAYHDSLGDFLTPELVADLDKTWPTLKDTYTQSKTVVSAKVSDVGVSQLQGDRAEVLIVQDVSMERDGAAAGSTSGTYLVTLNRVDGVWKLSKIPDLPS